jgi:UDP-N-acetylmuramyl pentapeptide phosphotransferase/UDP-N-acetylglucosamine-1-phosphate transferase
LGVGSVELSLPPTPNSQLPTPLGAVDVAALSLSLVLSAAITAVLILYAGSGTRRDWMVAGVVSLVLMAIGIIDLLTEKPRETHLATAIVGALLPVAGATGVTRALRNSRTWVRWLSVFLTAFVLLIAGLLVGASILPRFIGG